MKLIKSIVSNCGSSVVNAMCTKLNSCFSNHEKQVGISKFGMLTHDDIVHSLGVKEQWTEYMHLPSYTNTCKRAFMINYYGGVLSNVERDSIDIFIRQMKFYKNKDKIANRSLIQASLFSQPYNTKV